MTSSSSMHRQLLSVADAQILLNKCDGTILVINSGATGKDECRKSERRLVSSKANILGTLLNNFVLEKDHYYYNITEQGSKGNYPLLFSLVCNGEWKKWGYND